MDMPISDLVDTVRSIRQSHKSQAEKSPTQVIGRDTESAFNKLLDDSKNKCPEHPYILKMQPVNSGRTQIAGLFAKLEVLENSLKSEESRILRSLSEKK
jgi:hypothetical protein